MLFLNWFNSSCYLFTSKKKEKNVKKLRTFQTENNKKIHQNTIYFPFVEHFCYSAFSICVAMRLDAKAFVCSYCLVILLNKLCLLVVKCSMGNIKSIQINRHKFINEPAQCLFIVRAILPVSSSYFIFFQNSFMFVQNFSICLFVWIYEINVASSSSKRPPIWVHSMLCILGIVGALFDFASAKKSLFIGI